LFSHQWKVRSLVAFGKRRKNIFFTIFHFPPNKVYLNLFLLILRFYFTTGLNCYFTSFLPFLWLINCNHTSQCTNSSTHSLPNWFWSKFFSFLWIHGIMHDHILQGSNHTNEGRTTPGVVLRFDINPTPKPWKMCFRFKVEPP
jgi:hypothetical protein